MYRTAALQIQSVDEWRSSPASQPSQHVRASDRSSTAHCGGAPAPVPIARGLPSSRPIQQSCWHNLFDRSGLMPLTQSGGLPNSRRRDRPLDSPSHQARCSVSGEDSREVRQTCLIRRYRRDQQLQAPPSISPTHSRAMRPYDRSSRSSRRTRVGGASNRGMLRRFADSGAHRASPHSRDHRTFERVAHHGTWRPHIRAPGGRAPIRPNPARTRQASSSAPRDAQRRRRDDRGLRERSRV